MKTQQLFDRVKPLVCSFEQLSLKLGPVADLVLKVWVANVFFKSGLTKISSFDTTVMLFTYEYSVPVLSPTLAAYLSIGAELILPVLLLLGLAGRLSAFALFVFNAIAALSYPEISDAGIRDHIVWGIMLFAIMTNASHTFSLDHFIAKKWQCK